MSNRMKWIGVIGMFCWFVCGLSLGFNFGLKRGRAEQAKIDAAHPVVKEVPSEPIACPSPEVRVTTAGAVSSVWMCSTFVPAPAPPAKPASAKCPVINFRVGWTFKGIRVDEKTKTVSGYCPPMAAKPAKGSKRSNIKSWIGGGSGGGTIILPGETVALQFNGMGSSRVGCESKIDLADKWMPIGFAPLDGTVVEVAETYGVAPWYGLYHFEKGRWTDATDPQRSVSADVCLFFRPYTGELKDYVDPTNGAQNTVKYECDAMHVRYDPKLDRCMP